MLRIVTGLMSLALLAGPASAVDYGTTGHVGVPYYAHHHVLPVCDDGGVLSKVTAKFASYDSHIIGTGLAIEHIDGIRETAISTDGPSLIPRRYCRGTAWLSGGKTSEVVYLIEFQAGFASIHWNVQSCLPGFDPYRVYGTWCYSIRP